jgi:hypothetical protein
MKNKTPRPTPRPLVASIHNPPKEAGQLTLQVVSFAIFLSGQLFNLKCHTDWPTFATARSSTNYIQHAPRRTLLWLQPNTKIKQQDI